MSGTVDWDYNIYWNSSTAKPFYVVPDTKNLTEWKALGYDANTPNSSGSLDPLFRNYTGNYSSDYDFFLQSTSPAINEGTDVGITTDYEGRTRDATPDIGAFEFWVPGTRIIVSGTTPVTSGGKIVKIE